MLGSTAYPSVLKTISLEGTAHQLCCRISTEKSCLVPKAKTPWGEVLILRNLQCITGMTLIWNVAASSCGWHQGWLPVAAWDSGLSLAVVPGSQLAGWLRDCRNPCPNFLAFWH